MAGNKVRKYEVDIFVDMTFDGSNEEEEAEEEEDKEDEEDEEEEEVDEGSSFDSLNAE